MTRIKDIGCSVCHCTNRLWLGASINMFMRVASRPLSNSVASGHHRNLVSRRSDDPSETLGPCRTVYFARCLLVPQLAVFIRGNISNFSAPRNDCVDLRGLISEPSTLDEPVMKFAGHRLGDRTTRTAACQICVIVRSWLPVVSALFGPMAEG